MSVPNFEVPLNQVLKPLQELAGMMAFGTVTRSGTAQFSGAGGVTVTLETSVEDLNYDIYISSTIPGESYWVLDADRTLNNFTISSSNPSSTARVGWLMIARPTTIIVPTTGHLIKADGGALIKADGGIYLTV